VKKIDTPPEPAGGAGAGKKLGPPARTLRY
jgi:hypothetical protein